MAVEGAFTCDYIALRCLLGCSLRIISHSRLTVAFGLDPAALHTHVPAAREITRPVCVLDARTQMSARILSAATPPRQAKGVPLASRIVFDRPPRFLLPVRPRTCLSISVVFCVFTTGIKPFLLCLLVAGCIYLFVIILFIYLFIYLFIIFLFFFLTMSLGRISQPLAQPLLPVFYASSLCCYPLQVDQFYWNSGTTLTNLKFPLYLKT